MLDKQMLQVHMMLCGHTQKSLAKAIGISKNTMNLKINGNGFFDTEQIEKICDVLGIESGQEKAAIFLANRPKNGTDKKITPTVTTQHDFKGCEFEQ